MHSLSIAAGGTWAMLKIIIYIETIKEWHSSKYIHFGVDTSWTQTVNNY
jgi:hypothetical protein